MKLDLQEEADESMEGRGWVELNGGDEVIWMKRDEEKWRG
jgi:hypothetical protein